jgi:hypothetical protein
MSCYRWLERTPGLGADEFNFTEKYKVTYFPYQTISSAFLLSNDDIYKLLFLLGDHIRHSEGEHGQN